MTTNPHGTQTDTDTDTESDITPTDELWQVEAKTNDDGTVNAEILDWDKQTGRTGPTAHLSIRLPNGQRFSETMDWPAADDPQQFTFVRIVHYCGYSLSGADQLEGERVPCARTNGDWHVNVGYQPPMRQRLRTALKTIVLPVFMIRAFKQSVDEDVLTQGPFEYVFFSTVLLCVWAFGLMVAWVIFDVFLDLVGVVV